MYKEVLQWLLPLARRGGWEATLYRQLPVLAWPEAVGERLASLAKPLYVEGRTLHLQVANHVVATELRLVEQKLLERLSQALPSSRIRRLRFHVRPEPPTPPPPSPPTPEEEDWQAAEQAVPNDLPETLWARLVRLAAWARARERAILAAGGRRCPRCGIAHLGEGELCSLCALVEGEPEG